MIIQSVKPMLVPEQAYSIRRFVKQEDGNTDPAMEGPRRRYSKFSDALKNTVRLATTEGLHAYLLRKKRIGEVVGIATVIRGVRVESEDGLMIMAHDLDYVLREHATEAEHSSAAKLVVNASAKLAFRHYSSPVASSPFHWEVNKEDAVHNYVATIDPSNPQTNRGFRNIASLNPRDISYQQLDIDPYGLTEGADLEYLYGHQILTRRT